MSVVLNLVIAGVSLSPSEAVTIAVTLLVVLALYQLRAVLVPGVKHFPHHQFFFGDAMSLKRNWGRLSLWKGEEIRSVLDDSRSKQLEALMKEEIDGAQVEERIKTVELVQWSFPGAPSPFVEVLSARNVKYLLTDNFNNFEKGYLFADIFQETLGSGIFVVDGDEWRQQRKVASHLFSYTKLHDYMFETFTRESEKALKYLHQVAKEGTEIDFQRFTHEFTFDSICAIAFGQTQISTIGGKQPNAFSLAFDAVQSRCSERSLVAPAIWKMQRKLQLGAEKELSQNIKLLNEFIYGIVKDRRANLHEYEDSGDLLSLFLHDATKRGEEVSDDFLRDVIINFMLAGRDTTATALTWLFFSFHHNPATEAVCMDEVRNVLDANVLPTPEQIKSLVQLECAFMESVRLYPPVPNDMKLCVKECVFPSGETIPGGVYIAFSPFNLNRLPEYYQSCTTPAVAAWAKDCDQFRPSRWMTRDAETGKPRVLNPPSHEFLSFNSGPRLCLGKSMAILEGKLLAATILQTFHIKVREGYQPAQRVSPIYAILEGLPVTVHLRK